VRKEKGNRRYFAVLKIPLNKRWTSPSITGFHDNVNGLIHCDVHMELQNYA